MENSAIIKTSLGKKDYLLSEKQGLENLSDLIADTRDSQKTRKGKPTDL